MSGSTTASTRQSWGQFLFLLIFTGNKLATNFRCPVVAWDSAYANFSRAALSSITATPQK